MKEVMRHYCVNVLLGRPPKHTFAALLGLCRRSTPLWLTDRAPFYARFMGITVLSPPMDHASVLRELMRISEQYEGKMLTLLPATQDMKNFVSKNKELLEPNYRFAVPGRK